MGNFFENLVVNNQRKSILRESALLFFIFLAVLIFNTCGSASAKSLYVLSNISAYPNPLQVYDISATGKLTYQDQYSLPHHNSGSVAIAVDSYSGYLFVTYSFFDSIVLVNSENMAVVTEFTEAPGAYDLCGIVYDHKKNQLYCVDRGRNLLWAYNWDPNTVTLNLVEGAPFYLKNAAAYGIAVDEVDDLLYVANATNKVYAYSTNDWTLKRTITMNRSAVSVAVDVKNGYLYTGGGYVGNPYLSQYHLATNAQLETLVEPEAVAGVMGLAVDPNSSKVYLTTGNDNKPGGDNIRIFDKYLHQIDVINNVGNPTGLVVPGKEIGYNPLRLKKTVQKVVKCDGSSSSSTVDAGDLVTYRISFSNVDNDFTVTDVYVVDNLPDEVSFVSASDDGNFGKYEPSTHTYTWVYPTLVTNSTANLDITVKIKNDVPPKTTIINSVTVNSNSTPQSTTNAQIVTASNPLNIKKTVFGAISGQTKWVDANEVITYNIYVDNNDNSFPATDVLIVDTLPDDVVFVAADDDIFGIYDEASHTFSWSVSALQPNESLNVGITVRLKNDIPDGTIITNTATVSSVETASADASVDIRAGDGPLLVESVQVTPGTVKRNTKISGIMVILKMPQGYAVSDIKNDLLVLSFVNDPEALSVTANNDQVVTKYLGSTYIAAVFDKGKVMKAITGIGKKNVMVQGNLTNGAIFAGYGTLIITK